MGSRFQVAGLFVRKRPAQQEVVHVHQQKGAWGTKTSLAKLSASIGFSPLKLDAIAKAFGKCALNPKRELGPILLEELSVLRAAH